MLLINLEHLINILVSFFGYNLFPKYMNTCKNLRNLIEDCACTFCLNFLSYPCNLPNPCSLPGSSAINLNWTLKHIILEIFEMKFLKLVSSYYCLTKTLIKSVHTKVVCISQNMLGYSFAVKSSNYHISDKSKIHMKNNRLNYF